MQAVELYAIQNALVLRARGVELLVLPVHVSELKKLSEPKQFSDYFLKKAMVNRSARKLFEAWVKKDQTLWKRIYHSVMNDFNEEAASSKESSAE